MTPKAHTEVIITEMQKKPILWNVRHPKYHDRASSNRAWEHVASVVGLTKPVVKSKWKNIKDHFTKEYKKSATVGSDDSPPVYVGTWPFFNSLLFLKEPKLNPETNIKEENCPEAEDEAEGQLNGSASSNTSEYDESQIDNDYKDSSDIATLSLLEESATCLVPFSARAQSSSSHPVPEVSSHPKRAKKRKKDTSSATCLPPLQSEFAITKQNKQKLNASQDSEDDDLYFMKSLLPFIKGLPPLAKLNVRSKFLQIVTQEMMQQSYPQQYCSVVSSRSPTPSPPLSPPSHSASPSPTPNQ